MANNRRKRKINFIADVDANAPKLKHSADRPLRVPSFAVDVLGVSTLAVLFAGALGWAISGGDPLVAVGVGAAVGLVVVFWRSVIVFDRPVSDWEEIIYQDVWIDESEPDDIVAAENRVDIPDPASVAPVSFAQPKPGEFANWASAVLRDLRDPALAAHEKTSFSQNRAIRRGWPLGMYKLMFARFELGGWVVRQRNRPPTLTQHGEQILAAWVRNQQPGVDGKV